MGYRLATNWKNVIYFDETGQVVYEWDGDIIRLEKIKISRKKIKIKASINSVFVKDTKKVEILYHNENYPTKIKIENDIAVIEGEIPVLIQENDEIQFQVTCFCAAQKAEITFLKEEIAQKIEEDGSVVVSKDWCVMLERKRLIFIPNDNEGWKNKLNASLQGFKLNHSIK